MYLVEIEAGREELYQSVDALASAIRRGAIGPKSRIFHRTSSSWVSITLHPEFKKAIAVRASEPLPPLARRHWTFFGPDAIERAVEEAAAAAAAAHAAEPTSSPDPTNRPGWRARLGRAFGNLSLTPKISKTA